MDFFAARAALVENEEAPLADVVCFVAGKRAAVFPGGERSGIWNALASAERIDEVCILRGVTLALYRAALREWRVKGTAVLEDKNKSCSGV